APHPALRRACRPMRRGGGGTYVPRERLYKLARRASVPGRRCGERPPGGAATARGRRAAPTGSQDAVPRRTWTPLPRHLERDAPARGGVGDAALARLAQLGRE